MKEAEYCISLRKRAKKEEYLSPDERKFIRQMFKKFPGWYANTEKRVFDETTPFGSSVQYDQP